MKRILVVDDDYTQIVLIKTILTKSGYDVVTYHDPLELVAEYKLGYAEAILSDINMPGLSGMELVNRIREIDPHVPFIMFTATSDIKSVVEFFKTGISDYINKPIVPEDLVHRLEKVLKDVDNNKELHKAELERDLIELERNKLISWKNLYASKDIKQTKQMMSFFSRTINADGGYIWLDMLNKLKAESDGSYILSSDLYDLITDSANSQRKAFDFISYINKLPNVKTSNVSLKQFTEHFNRISNEVINPLINESERDLSFNFNDLGQDGSVSVDLSILKDIILELTVNSIKFSPENSQIVVEIYKEEQADSDTFKSKKGKVVFKIRNSPKSGDLKGIPYDYTELVFDLFYTLESYILQNPNEKWSNGTGLYIARQLAHDMNIWIECGNIDDYSGSIKKQYVQFKLSIPIN